MRFNCGLSYKEKEDRLFKKAQPLRKWHSWFAWWPIRVETGQCVWLEKIERKLDWIGCITHNFYFEYRIKED